jgi:hypothetical protein
VPLFLLEEKEKENEVVIMWGKLIKAEKVKVSPAAAGTMLNSSIPAAGVCSKTSRYLILIFNAIKTTCIEEIQKLVTKN